MIKPRVIIYFHLTAKFELTNKYCAGVYYGEKFDNFSDAKERCSYEPGCKGVYDSSCDDINFMLCDVGRRLTDDDYNCLYEKTGNVFSQF